MSTVWDDSFEYEVVRKTHPLFDPEKTWKFLHQTKIWVNSELQELRIKDLEKMHLFNILKWANNHKDDISFTLNMAENIGKIDDITMSWFDLNDFPLFVRITEQYLKKVGAK